MVIGKRVPSRRMSSSRRYLVVAVAIAMAMTAACTRDKNDVESGPNSTTTTTAGEGTGGTGDQPGPGDFGTLKDVCGPAPSGETNTASAQGVTEDSIKIGTISDPGFVGRQGLNQEMFDASEVFVKWCNAAGGINGRQIDDTERDAKLTEYKQRITESCAEDFALVGGGGVFDDTGQAERLSCLEPAIPAYVVSSQARGADLQVQPLPNALDSLSVAALVYVAKKYPDSTSKVGYITGNVPSTITIDKQLQEGGKQLGFKSVYNSQYNAVGEASWAPFAQSMQQKGVKGIVWTGEPENLVNLLKALQDINYEPEWVVAAANHYDQRLIDLGGAAVKNVYMQSAFVPFFDAKDNPPTQQYLDLFKQYLPKGKSEALLAVQSWSSWLLFATAAKECGADLTRKCLYDKAKAVKSWTGGGLHAETNPNSDEAPECTAMIEATPDGFKVPDDFKPTEGKFYACDPKYVAHLTGNYGQGTTLASVGKSLSDLK